MGLIDIDDRDVINYYGNTSGEAPEPVGDKFKEWLGILKGEMPTSVINHLGAGRYKIDMPVVTCTGSDVTTVFNVPFMHKFQKMDIKHVDAAKADSNNPLDYTVSHRHHPNLWLMLLDITDSIASDIIDEYIDYNMDRGEYRIVSDSTNTELLYISVYIRLTGN